MGNFKDITNKTFGYLTAIAPTKRRSNGGNVIWECACSCGRNTCAKIIFAHSGDLAWGTTNSCQQQQHDKSIHPAIRQYFTNTRYNAYYRNYIFELTLVQFITIIQQPCRYCGANNDIKRITQHGKQITRWALRANGIDRRNNDLGYTVENSIPCCALCNLAKRSMSAYEYINHCKNVAANNILEDD